MHPAIQNLMDCQRQLDMDGVEVGVSRQALDETLAVIAQLRAALKRADALIADRLGWLPTHKERAPIVAALHLSFAGESRRDAAAILLVGE